MTPPLKIWDPHFHIWDVRPTTPSGHDGAELFAPRGNPRYTLDLYEKDILTAGQGFEPIGGTFVEAVSVCHLQKTGDELATDCLAEAQWVAEQFQQSQKKYALVASAPLEVPHVEEILLQLAANPHVCGVRQILNFEPSWPRNRKLGNLLENPQWQEGFAKLADFSWSFDMQLNPHQFQKAAALLEKFPHIPVIINHLGTPTLQDLQEPAGLYWKGLEALAACQNTFMKISMLWYPAKQWHENPTVLDAVHRVIEIFGVERCFFASNFPVDAKEGWSAERLYPAFRKLVEAQYGLEEQQKLFAENAQVAYGVA